MYKTGIFPKFCSWEWDLSTGKWDFEKKWAGKWDWYPRFRTVHLIWWNSIFRGFIFVIQAFSTSFFLEMTLNLLKFLGKLEQVDAYSFKCFNVFYMSQPKIQNGTYPPKLLTIWVLIDTHPVFLNHIVVITC